MYVAGLMTQNYANTCGRPWSHQDNDRSDISRISFVRLAVSSSSARRTMDLALLDGPSSYPDPSVM